MSSGIDIPMIRAGLREVEQSDGGAMPPPLAVRVTTVTPAAPPPPPCLPIPSPSGYRQYLQVTSNLAGMRLGVSPPPPFDFQPDATVGLLTSEDFAVPTLGSCRYDSGKREARYSDNDRILFQSHFRLPLSTSQIDPSLAFECAGSRAKIHWAPDQVVVGIVTCGGICPGLNDVVRAVTYSSLSYGCQKVYGFRYGYQGLSAAKRDYIELTYQNVNQIHYLGGTILGTSRGDVPPEEMLDTLKALGVNILFTVGGDGTQRGAEKLFQLITTRGEDIAVIGIPKTIDNDIPYISRTFGFDTSVEMARDAINSAHIEATSLPNGLGIVKLMGRDSGFIAAKATLSSGDVNFCLIPEEEFDMNALLAVIEHRLQSRGHAVLVVAEGAGQHFFDANGNPIDQPAPSPASVVSTVSSSSNAAPSPPFRMAAGTASAPVRPIGPAAATHPMSPLPLNALPPPPTNKKLGDIAGLLKKRIEKYFEERGVKIGMKYIDPSYLIRSCRANANDAAFCTELGNKAVDSALAGKTGCIVGYWNDEYTLVPFSMLAKGARKKINLRGHLWNSVKGMTEF